MLRHYITKNGRTMRCGYTTGSCAAGAAKAAAMMLLTGEIVREVTLDTPKGIRLTLEILNPGFQSRHPAVFLEIVIRKVELQHHIAQIVRQPPVRRILRELFDLRIQVSGYLAEILLALHSAERKCLAADRNINIVFNSHIAALSKKTDIFEK